MYIPTNRNFRCYYVTEILDVNMPFDKMQRSPQHNQKESLYLLKCIKDHQKGSYF